MPRHKEFDYNDKLVAARNLFWEKGYNNTSLNDLVDTLKINRSSLYMTYGSKHNLFLECLDNYLREKEKEYSKAAAKSKKPLEAVSNVIRYVLETILRDSRTCLAVNSTFELARTDKEVNKLLKKQISASVKQLADLLTEAKERGELNTDKEPHALAHFIVSGMAAIWSTHILYSDEKLTRQMADFLLKTVAG